ncbi:MAG: peptidylprolyl isomerase, partial [Candidatus Helarchaeota archaeon]|nr:peptidylprolyl isomerase [Candidatus Helarchaeota archaeon]
VIEGMDVVDKIANAPRNENNDRPLKEIMMKSLKIIKEK